MSIKKAQERRIEVYKKRPSSARSTGKTQAKLDSGTRCEIVQDGWTLVCDQSKLMGGEDGGPDPGMFGRGALGACLAQGYAIQLAIQELSFDSICVEVQSEIDGLGSVGIDDAIPPGYQSLRYFVCIESDEDDVALREAIDIADRTSPWLYNFVTALPIEREVEIKSRG